VSRWTVFLDAFLVGFTMAGFMTWLKQPGAATGLCAPSPVENKQQIPSLRCGMENKEQSAAANRMNSDDCGSGPT
jgi:hypothetical protein